MANNDDEILTGEDNDFDFELPSDAHDELVDAEMFDDNLMSEADIYDVGSGQVDHEIHDELADFSLENDEFDESILAATDFNDGGGHGSDENHTGDGNDEPQRKSGPGWKTWTSIGVVGFLLLVGGLWLTFMPASPRQQAPTEAGPNLPPPPPAPRQEARDAPVNVEAFPSVTPPQAKDGRPDTKPAPAGDSVIPDPYSREQRDSTVISGEPEYMQGVKMDRSEFESVSGAVRENIFKLDALQDRLNNFEADTTKEMSDLDRRVTALENRHNNSQSNKENDFNVTESPTKGESQEGKAKTKMQPAKAQDKKATEKKFVYSVPKSPAEIKALQRKLDDHGYRPGKIDGILGSQTRWAIKRLQKEHGLEANGWLGGETMVALENPKRYSGTYPKQKSSKPEKVATKRSSKSVQRMASPAGKTLTWFVRGVTPSRAVVYRQDGLSYAVSVGSEIPGMGQVTKLDPENHQVVTANGKVSKR